jgi:molybdopterin synthase sulfur carrier subunit
MTVTVKFIGALRHASNVEKLALTCSEQISVKEMIDEVSKDLPELQRSLLDSQSEEPRPNALILVNGREISALNGLETRLNDGDEVVLVPVVHGG